MFNIWHFQTYSIIEWASARVLPTPSIMEGWLSSAGAASLQRLLQLPERYSKQELLGEAETGSRWPSRSVFLMKDTNYWKSSRNGDFNRKIIYKWWICHCHVWLPEGSIFWGPCLQYCDIYSIWPIINVPGEALEVGAIHLWGSI